MDNFIKDYHMSSHDIPNVLFNEVVSNKYASVDIETNGLSWIEDRIATIQINTGDFYFIYQHVSESIPSNLIKLFEDENIVKYFHHAMFDMRFISRKWNVNFQNIRCTKIASKLLRHKPQNNSLKHLLNKYLQIDISKHMQLSNWERNELSNQQIEYALDDVKYLKDLYLKLEKEIERQELLDKAYACFDFAPTLVWLQLNKYESVFEY